MLQRTGKITIRLVSKNGANGGEMILKCESTSTIIDEHNEAALLFACEFAINNAASNILGAAVRAHITME